MATSPLRTSQFTTCYNYNTFVSGNIIEAPSLAYGTSDAILPRHHPYTPTRYRNYVDDRDRQRQLRITKAMELTHASWLGGGRSCLLYTPNRVDDLQTPASAPSTSHIYFPLCRPSQVYANALQPSGFHFSSPFYLPFPRRNPRSHL